MVRLLPDRLSRELAKNHGLSLPDFEILVKLSEAPEAQMRMSHLADRTLASRSRLSHACNRLEKSGFIDAPSLRSRRPGLLGGTHGPGLGKTHVRQQRITWKAVRSHLVDLLTPSEFAELGRIALKVSEHLQDVDDHASDD